MEPITTKLIQDYSLIMCEVDCRLSQSGDIPRWFRDERNMGDTSFRLNHGHGLNSNYARYHEDYNWLMPLWFDLNAKVGKLLKGDWYFQISDNAVSAGSKTGITEFERIVDEGYEPTILDIWYVCGQVAEYFKGLSK